MSLGSQLRFPWLRLESKRSLEEQIQSIVTGVFYQWIQDYREENSRKQAKVVWACCKKTGRLRDKK